VGVPFPFREASGDHLASYQLLLGHPGGWFFSEMRQMQTNRKIPPLASGSRRNSMKFSGVERGALAVLNGLHHHFLESMREFAIFHKRLELTELNRSI
jgi:hypothetical protein